MTETSDQGFLLDGLVRCGRCGAAMVGASSHGRRLYRCTGSAADKDGRRKVCRPARWIDAEGLDALVWDAVCNLLRNPETMRGEFDRRREERGEQYQDVQAAFEEFLEDISAGLDALDFAEQQQIVRDVLRGVVVDVDRHGVKIQTILPMYPKAAKHSGTDD